MDRRLPGGVPAVRLASRLQLATFFATDSTSPSNRCRRQQAGSRRRQAPALTADVRVVIRRHFPVVVVGGGTRIAVEVAEDIALRRRPSRKLRGAESVERALAQEVLPLVAHPFDRGAVAASRKQICAHVAAACADPRIARCGAHVLVLIDTFACPVVFRRLPVPLPPKPMKAVVACAPKSFVVTSAKPCCMEELESDVPVPGKKPVGVVGDRRPKPVVEERYKGWVPW
ncbi:hypothetical protein BDA96_01G411900 [Sorghum bicolor]|uniref:Uncharacterized protein n=2 Tax=Sorghum bicolor TaxID=4558 RepID=A0A921V1J6_SORBI|nr:hypothetical protein BDA96_01G411900 [Sorghum bicolor]KXG39477.1 hypothetical protein SORBI_3001G387400 [Sorghum bicolor]